MINLVRQDYEENISIFNKTKKQLYTVLENNVVVEHIGSTAIPEMSGKNIIDIVIGVEGISEIEKTTKQVETINFYRGTTNPSGEYIFLASRIEETRSGDVHIHVVDKDSDLFNDFIVLKNYLLDHPLIAREYAEMKYILAEKTNNERKEYKKLKHEYVEELLVKAREYDKK